MTWSTMLMAFAASFVFIYTKSWQQLNVQHRLYWLIVPTSMAMAVCEVWVIANAAHSGWGWIVLPIGVGSGLGSLSATYIHHTMMRKKHGSAG